MNKKARQYIGIIIAVILYYIIHEGAHFLYALCIGTFKQINFMGVGIQIDVFSEKMTERQIGIFCAVGAVSTFIASYILVILAKTICRSGSKLFMSCMYYITMIMMLLDPVYLSLLCGFFGGGDMNGIAMLVPEAAARIFFGALLIVNAIVFAKAVLPVYKQAFTE